MNTYIDSSVLLRVVLKSPNPLAEWDQIDQYVSSILLRIECARTLQRMRFDNVPPEETAEHQAAIAAIVDNVKLVAIDEEIVGRAGAAFAVPLKSLDAIHLASAMAWRDHNHVDLAFATHDDKLARAARAAGFTVFGA